MKTCKRICLLLSFLSLSICACNVTKTEASIIDETKYENLNYDIYLSIIEVILKKEVSTSSYAYQISDFPEVDISYVSNNFFIKENNRRELIFVLKNPTKENVISTISNLKNNEKVYDARLVELQSPGSLNEKNLMDSSYNNIFNGDDLPSEEGKIILYSNLEEINDDNFYKYSEEDFPEIEIDSISTSAHNVEENIYLFIAEVELKDHSLSNVNDSLLALRYNSNLNSVTYSFDGGFAD